MKAFRWIILVVSAVYIFVGCKEEIDDQTIAKGDSWKAANPTPVARPFAANNERHKVLVAVIDSGVDYNHPSLINNMHFNLNDQGQPTGLGYDFTGKDYWPSPYVARTLDLNLEADPKDVPKTKNARTNSASIVKLYPQLKNFIDPLRNIEQESESGAFHGTHVSGLSVYDDPQIGLIPYRVLPLNIIYKDGKKDTTIDQTEVAFKNIMQAMTMAVKAGARVVNMSLALKGPDESGSLFSLTDNRKRYFSWMKLVKDFMESNPDVVFVAAAGNDSKWVDDKVNLQLPCGVSVKNMVCVGALSNDGNMASFSNIVLSQVVFVATNGVDIESTRPKDMCDSSALSNLDTEQKNLEYAAQSLVKDCVNKKPIRKASGTSMASPIVARVVARLILENPSLNGEETIQVLVERSQKIHLGPLSLNKVKFELPSWSKKNYGP